MFASAEQNFLRKLGNLECGRFELQMPNGRKEIFEGRKPGPIATLALRDWRVIKNLIVSGDIGFAEDYREGLWDSENLQDLLSLALANEQAMDALIFGGLPARAMARLMHLFSRNTRAGSRKNISAHYDLGNDFYALWLDKTMTYSSGLFEKGQMSLEAAQNAKYDRLIDRMEQSSGSILEIGCGWGGFAARALEKGDFSIKGITLSERQKLYAENRLKGCAHIALEDYRDQTGEYDNIVSIEMFEAVGEEYWKTYFDKICESLKVGGMALIQTITIADDRFERYRKSGDFIRKHVFPGGMLPSPAMFEKYAQASGLRLTDRFYFGGDYARTLELWLKNFDACRPEIQALGYNDSFIRMWRFYLAACIASFRTGRTNVMQVEMQHAI
jgi:cyclopropane-fatty-acyl-phospholipid synthase